MFCTYSLKDVAVHSTLHDIDRIPTQNVNIMYLSELVAKFSDFGGSPGIPFDHWLRGWLRQSNSAQQVGVARVGAQPMPEWVHCKIEQASGMLLIRLFKETERLILVA